MTGAATFSSSLLFYFFLPPSSPPFLFFVFGITVQLIVLFCSLAVLDPRVGHAMDVLSPFISVLCHSD